MVANGPAIRLSGSGTSEVRKLPFKIYSFSYWRGIADVKGIKLTSFLWLISSGGRLRQYLFYSS